MSGALTVHGPRMERMRPIEPSTFEERSAPSGGTKQWWQGASGNHNAINGALIVGLPAAVVGGFLGRLGVEVSGRVGPLTRGDKIGGAIGGLITVGVIGAAVGAALGGLTELGR